MTSKLALGSVSTLAMGALLLAALPHVTVGNAGSMKGTPWGGLSGLAGSSKAIVLPEPPDASVDRAQLLKLASLAPGAKMPEPVQAVPEAPAERSVVQPVPAAEPVAAPAPQVQQAALETTGSVAPTDAGDTAVNINTASVGVLDHLPGAGRIGKAIVEHRPYKSVNDLVRKRVLRTSDFQKIQAYIRVD